MRSPDFPQDKPVETGGVHHSDALHYGSADLHAPEAPADETQPLDGPLEVEDLQHGAPGDEGVDVPVLHDDAADAELAEVGEGGAFEGRRARELPEAKVEAGEGDHPEERVGEGHTRDRLSFLSLNLIFLCVCVCIINLCFVSLDLLQWLESTTNS